MMRVPRFGPLLFGSAAAAVAVLIASPLPAQQGVITGRVTSPEGDPLGGASVSVANTNVTAVTAADGTYQITVPGAVTGRQVTLTARYIGHRPGIQSVTLGPGPQQVNFQLAADPFRLDEVVVTGTAEAVEARKLSFAVATVSDERLKEVPGANALVAIQGKVAGARIVPLSAQPGSEVAIRLRGATSIGGRQDPLFIVDGVITWFGIADIAPEDVERVEIVKGAAASSLYGSNAANGVVQIFTKRGRSLPEGTLRVTARTEAGVNNMPKRMTFSQSHAWEVNETPTYCASKGWTVAATGNYCIGGTGARITKTDQIADNPFSLTYDPWEALVKSGRFWTGYTAVGQRRGTTNFNASFENTRNQGVIFGLGGYTRQNYRLNLDQQFRPNVDGSFSAFYGTSTNGRAQEGTGSPFFGLMFVQPDVDITVPDSVWGFNCTVPLSGDVANDFNPLCELENRKITQDRNRFSGSGRLRWRMLDWLTAEGSFAYDQEGELYKDFLPFGYPSSTGTPSPGFLLERTVNNYQHNSSATLTSSKTFGAITNTTRLAAVFENQRNRWLQSSSGTLIVARVPEFAGADPSSHRSASRDERIRNQNFYAVTTFDIKGRYILDGLVRRDASSLFGPESRWSTYYRVSGAWRITEDVRLPGIDEFKLRGSYGTAGLRPRFDNQYEILQVTPGGFTKNILGNPLLKPARAAEVEVGTNLEFGGGRFTAEYTYADKTTKDQILLVDLPAVAGFRAQWQNTGELRSKTHEATFGARLIDTRSTSLTLNIVGDRTRQVITEWDLPERLYSFQQMPAAFFLGKNSNLGVLYGNHWIRNIDELYDDPAKAALSGAGQTWSRDSVMINEDGYVVRKSAYGTTNERAVKYVRCKRTDASGTCVETTNIVQIGDGNPEFNLSFGATLNVNRLVVNGLLDWSYGGDLYNGTRQWAFQATRDRAQDQGAASGKPDNAATCGTAQADPTVGSCPRKALPYYAVGFYNGLDPNDYFIENGSYAKLKELSVNYTFVSDQLRSIGLGALQELRLGIIARNLFTITKYSGLDPEISGLAGDPFQVRMDWFQYPQFRTYTAVVEITF
ncbi:MAG: SusC/RagA family TonB-linked outer membrane protein [Gemmatimonadetes bacterium]|nr:SusC/RagA family TonB-linked outer membrane protein [Gemmatimonadota bacterium]